MTNQFHAERAGCVGGSDLPHLLQLPPYGCRRRLWYEKSQVPADFPFTGNPATERGLACESFAAGDFLREHQDVVLRDRVPFRSLSTEHPMVGCHADRLLHREGFAQPYSVLEIKCPSARVYYTGRGSVDPPNEGKIQANYCAGIWGTNEAVVQWFSSDSWRSRFWHFRFDPVMFADCVSAAVDFWATLEFSAPPYEPLPDDDPRCNNCPWRGRCKGLDLDAEQGQTPVDFAGPRLVDLGMPMQDIERLALDLIALKAQRDTATAAYDIAKAEMISLFPGPGKVETPAAVISYTESHRKGYIREVKPGVTRTLRVKPAKEEDDNVAIDTE